jgi:hypothetical protein
MTCAITRGHESVLIVGEVAMPDRHAFRPLPWALGLACLASAIVGADADPWQSTAEPLLKQYCWSCHGETKQKGELDLQRVGAALAKSPELLAKVEERVVALDMPPKNAEQPSGEQRDALLTWVRAARSGGATVADDPGEVVIPRLTPAGYNRMIQAITGIDPGVAAMLPRDGGAGEGFDNVGAAQPMTQMHLRAYLAAAKQVVAHARILPYQPIEWIQASRTEARTPEDFERELMTLWDDWFAGQKGKQVAEHLQTLKGILPSDEVWTKTCSSVYQFNTRYLIVYLHAVWQYQHRAELGHADWTPEDVALSYQPKLRKELVRRLAQLVDAPSENVYWRGLCADFAKLPPPPRGDDEMRQLIFELMRRFERIQWIINDGGPPEPIQPFEVDPTTWLTKSGEARSVMTLEGRRPFRFNVTGKHELWLVTTDGADGPDGDYMIWEKGVLLRDGKEVPWTEATLTDGAGKPIPWGMRPIADAPALPADSVEVQAPAVIHIVFPAGTTAFRVDAHADPQFAKSGTMQAAPFDREPTAEELRYVPNRWLFSAPPQTRPDQYAKWFAEIRTRYEAGSGGIPPESYALLPAEVGQYWNLHAPKEPEEKDFSNPKATNSWGHPLGPWYFTNEVLLSYTSTADRDRLDKISAMLRTTIERRHALVRWLGDHHVTSPAGAALLATEEPEGLKSELKAEYQKQLASARADEERLARSAREQVAAFAAKAWRAGASEEKLEALMALYQGGRDEGLCYEAAVKRALVPVLASPRFIYREQHAKNQATAYPLAGRELAERLAAVIWGSLPDDELLKGAGNLGDPEELRRQIRRMVLDRRCRNGLAAEFAGQAFLFAGFASASGPDRKKYPEFTDSIRGAMVQEYVTFFERLFEDDRPLTDLIDCDYAFVNDELAAYYGIKDVKGPQVRRVAVDRAQRGGLLGMGAFLVSTSAPLRSSPIKRGKWIVEQVLGMHLDPPPPVVPQISAEERSPEGMTIVQQMARHRSDARCMACHAKIDPMGVALEGFGASGRRRADIDGAPVVDRETAADGSTIAGLAGLKSWLLQERQLHQVMRNLCVKFVGYALGRAVIPSDQALIDRVMADLEAHGWRSSFLNTGVLASPQYTQRRDEVAAATEHP